MSIAGALIFVTLGFGGMSLNIYTEVGLVTLMGLISKHGILIVQFANHLQQAGRTKREAIEEAAGIRLRPILMTTAAMVLGVVPLITASGAGAVSRFQMGVVIAPGLSIGTLFTLFVVPAVYLVFAADHHATRRAARRASPIRTPPDTCRAARSRANGALRPRSHSAVPSKVPDRRCRGACTAPGPNEAA